MRKVSSLWGRLSWLIVVACVCVPDTQAQDSRAQEPPKIDAFAFDFTQFLFQQTGLEFERWSTVRQTPRESVMVLLGEIPDDYDPHLREFVQQGGALLIATDRGVRGNQLINMRAGNIRVTDPAIMYQGYEDCFRVLPDSHPDLTEGVREIILNRSGSLAGRAYNSRFWKELAWGPDQQILIAAYEHPRHGPVVALGDHSPFTNGMLMHGDNAVFTMNVINWLNPDGVRKRIAFVVNGDELVAPNLDPTIPDAMPNISPDDIPKDSWLSIANHFLREVDRGNVLNRWLADVPKSIVWRWVLLITTVIAGLFVGKRLVGTERPIVRPPDENPSNASEARAAEMLRTGSARPAAMELARQFFRDLTGSREPANWALRKKDIHVASDVSGARRIRKDIEMLTHLASGADRKHIDAKRLRHLAKRIDELAKLVAEGRLRVNRPAGQLDFES